MTTSSPVSCAISLQALLGFPFGNRIRILGCRHVGFAIGCVAPFAVDLDGADENEALHAGLRRLTGKIERGLGVGFPIQRQRILCRVVHHMDPRGQMHDRSRNRASTERQFVNELISPITTSSGEPEPRRTAAITVCPAALNCPHNALPTKPVVPVTSTLQVCPDITGLLYLENEANVWTDSAQDWKRANAGTANYGGWYGVHHGSPALLDKPALGNQPSTSAHKYRRPRNTGRKPRRTPPLACNPRPGTA